jgi:glycosyltransferase involved in cell wall biosynthesis
VPPPAYGGIEVVIDSLAWAEPFGIVMIEARAQGTPVIATLCGVPELIDDGVTGFVRSSDVDLALALRAVPTLDRSRCRQAATERFSTKRMVADHLAVYERIVAERHPRRAA